MSTRKLKTSEVKRDSIKKENENVLTSQKKSNIKIFQGRLNRGNFVMSILLTPIISLKYLIFIFIFWAVLTLVSTIFGFNLSNGESIVGGVISLILVMSTLLIPSFIATIFIIKRHHDLNQSGYYYLIFCITVYLLSNMSQELAGLVVFIYFCYLIFKTGTNGNNKYGDEDKQKGLKNILGMKR